MAKFVESAILKVIDQSSRNLSKIERALKSFRTEANRLKRVDLNINTGRVKNATREINALGRAIRTISTPKINASGINSTTAALRRLQVQAAKLNGTRVNIRTGASGGGMGGGGMGGGGGPRRYGMGPGGGVFRINASALDIWSAGFIHRLGSTIESAITTGFREGTKNVSQSYLRNQALGYNPDQIGMIDRESARISRENPNFTRSDVRTWFAEIGPTLGKDPSRSIPLIEMAATFANSRLTQTGNTEEAQKGIRALFKTLDNINRLQDSNGNISSEAKDYMRVLIEESIISGADIDPEKINTAVTYARTTGKTLSPEGFRTLIGMLESMGRVSGSSLNRFVENLSGNTTAKALNAQAEWGLITMGQREVGKTGKKSRTENFRESTVAGELLRTDPNAWVVQELIPRLKQRGIDLNNAAQVADAVTPLFGSVVAKDVAANLAMWQAEYQTRLEAARNIPTNEAITSLVNNNGLLTFQSIGKQTTELLGEIGTTLLNKVNGPLQSFRDTIMSVSNFLGGEERSGTNTAIVGGAAAGVGLAGLWAGSKIKNFLLSPIVLAGSLDTASAAALRFATTLDGVGGLPGGDGPGKRRKTKVPFAPIGPTATTAIVAAAVGGEAALLNYGKEHIESQPRHAEDIKRFETWRQNASAWLKNLGSSLPAGNMPAQPEGMTTTPFDWKRFFIGDLADGGTLRDALGIQTGVEMGADRLRTTFEEGSTMIGSKGPELAAGVQDALMAVAGPFGAAIAASMQSNFTPPPLSVNVNAGTPVDTGANPNNAR
ncbi:tape measure protein [Agrobacterium phage Milano]|nr:tape measure protein [Agrobacterium phage Milano]